MTAPLPVIQDCGPSLKCEYYPSSASRILMGNQNSCTSEPVAPPERKIAKRQGKSIDCIPDEVVEILQRHNWQGNIRELHNAIERAVILTTGSILNIQTTGLMAQNVELASIKTLADAERTHITATLRDTNRVVGGPRGAAVKLGIPRTTLISIMQRLGIRRDCYGKAGQTNLPLSREPEFAPH